MQPPAIIPGPLSYHTTSPLSVAPPIQGSSGTNTRKKRKAPEEIASGSKRLKADLDEQESESPPADSSLPENAVIQAASYALELLANTSGTRTHCLQMVVDGTDIQFWYYDAGGMIYSKTMSWVEDFEKFAAIIIAFASLDLAQWGIGAIPGLIPPKSRAKIVLPRSLSRYSLMMVRRVEEDGKEESQNVRVTLDSELFTQYSLVGRRTTVYSVKTEPKISDSPLIIKISMQPTLRTPEHELVAEARSKGVEHLPMAHLWTEKAEELSLSKGVWGKIFPKNEEEQDEKKPTWLQR